jgi:hypothetical protein
LHFLAFILFIFSVLALGLFCVIINTNQKKGIDKKENMVYTLISGGLKWFKMDKDGLKCL